MIKTGAVAGAGLAAPTLFSPVWAANHAGYTNAPQGGSVTLGFNVPQTGPYADEGADELRAYQLAVEHLNGEGDGGMLNTFSEKNLKGNGILGKKVEYVMITGGSSSGVAIAVQGLCQDAGVIFMAGLTHSNDTTGKDKKANGFRHFFNGYMSGAALAPVLEKMYGADRTAYHLTADYTWGWTQQESIHLGSEPLRRKHGQLFDFCCSVRSARQAGKRQELRDRCAALLSPDGTWCR